MGKKRERFYRGSIFLTLDQLEMRCETDESNLSSELINLELGNQNNNDGTIGTYEESEEPDIGNLIFKSYKNEADANLIETEQELGGAKKMFRGKAQIGNNRLKITVLRG